MNPGGKYGPWVKSVSHLTIFRGQNESKGKMNPRGK